MATAAPSETPPEKEGKADVIARISDLPRPKQLWQAAGLSARTVDEAGKVVTADAVFAWDAKKREIVSVDLSTGKQRWRAKLPREAADASKPWLGVIGSRVVARFLREASIAAYAASSGKLEWYSPLGCLFIFGLQGDGEIASGTCMEKAPEPKPGQPMPRNFERKSSVVGVDMTTGEELWRKPVEGRYAQVASDGQVVVMAPVGQFSQTPSAQVLLLEARTGKELWKTEVPDMLLSVGLDAKSVFLVGAKLRTLSRKDGKALWSYETTDQRGGMISAAAASPSGFEPQLLGGLLVWPQRRGIVGIDPATGKEARRWPLPAAEENQQLLPMALVASGKRMTLVLRGFGLTGDQFLVMFEGEKRNLVALPSASTQVVGIQGDTLVVADLDRGNVDAYSLAQLIGSEAQSLKPAERVRALLERAAFARGVDSEGSKGDLSELKSIAGYEGILVDLASDPKALVRRNAVVLLAELHIAAGTKAILAILDEKMPPEPKWPGPKLPEDRSPTPEEHRAYSKYRPPREYQEKQEKFESASYLWTSAVNALTKLDSPEVSKRLAPLLAGKLPSWLDRPDGRFASNRRPSVPELPRGMAAGIYRQLVRVGGAAEIAALKAFEGGIPTVSGGWSRLCPPQVEAEGETEPSEKAGAASKVTGGKPAAKRLAYFRCAGCAGLCGRGVEAGDFMVVEGNGLWLRRRQVDGWGPPILAQPAGPAGCAPVAVLKAEVVGKKLSLHGAFLASEGRSAWSAELDVEAALADRDGDGLPDRTEAAFGTDPGKPDSDGDGVTDLNDGAPLAGSAKSEEAKAVAAVIRYRMTVESPNVRSEGREPIVEVRGDSRWAGEIAGLASMIVHRPVDKSARRGERKPSVASRVIPIAEVKVSGDQATVKTGRGEVEVVYDPGTYKLKRLDGVWRVAEVEDSRSGSVE